MKEPFVSALPILQKLNDHHYEAYFVGGSIRDLLMERKISDIDIATSARPDEIMALFPNHVPVGAEHGTVLVLYENKQYEITTFRIDGEYKDYRHPEEVIFVSSLEQDLSRRDFTMNAIAMDKDGTIIDPFHGREDIRHQKIRTVGNAIERFTEDPLRMLRGIRFVSQLSFELEDSTYQAIAANYQLMKHISVERIKIEFEKLLQGKSVNAALNMIVAANFFETLPGLAGKKEQLLHFSTLSIQTLQDIAEYWSLLLLVLQEYNTDAFLRQWKSARHMMKDVEQIVRTVSSLQDKRLSDQQIYTLGLSLSLASARVQAVLYGKDLQKEEAYVQDAFYRLPLQSKRELQVNGNDLLEWTNQLPGPWIGEKMREIETAIIDGKLKNDKNDIKRWVMACSQK